MRCHVLRHAVLLLLPAFVGGHVNLMWPPSRIQNPSGVPGAAASVFPSVLDGAGGCPNFACLWFNQGCQPGCSRCTDRAGGPVSPHTESEDMCSEVNGTMPPSVSDPQMRTYRDTVQHGDWTKNNPWRSPGYAPVFSPCGQAGGGNSSGDWMSDALTRHIRSGAVTPPFIRRGFDGRDLPAGPKAVWPQGSHQEVAWSMFLNHGGGYAYRMCPKSNPSGLTEECFQRHHLHYSSDQSWIQYSDERSNRTAILARRISEGTWPRGSPWTKNPIPPCMTGTGPVQGPTAVCPEPMFEPPLVGLFGDGAGTCVDWAIHGPVEGYQDLYDSYGTLVSKAKCTRRQGLNLAKQFQFNIYDEVVVPSSFPPGEYVLSFRLDAEQGPQIWAQCADITITETVLENVGVVSQL